MRTIHLEPPCPIRLVTSPTSPRSNSRSCLSRSSSSRSSGLIWQSLSASGLSTIACALISSMFLLIEALFVALFRGARNVDWVRPPRCDDIKPWVSAEWCYYGRCGMQVGARKFGLEVARKGYLGRRHPLI
jgi:hypothetical protein